jgi:hypothetical protein
LQDEVEIFFRHLQKRMRITRSDVPVLRWHLQWG